MLLGMACSNPTVQQVFVRTTRTGKKVMQTLVKDSKLHAAATCRGFAHPEVCKNPDPLLLFGGQSEHTTYHGECPCMMHMCITRLSKKCEKQ